jgi:hypothetical protein
MEQECGDGTPKARPVGSSIRQSFATQSAHVSRAFEKMFGKHLGPRVLALFPGIFRMFLTIVGGMILIYFDHKDSPDHDTPTGIQCLCVE